MPRAFEIVATPSADDDQITDVVRSWVVASVKTPVAVNSCVVPFAMLGSGGVTSMESRVADVTVSVVVPVSAPKAAVIVVEPTATALARPWEPMAFEIVAIPGSEDDHVADAVRSWVVESVKSPVAVNCCVVPFAMDGAGGSTAIETRLASVIVTGAAPAIFPSWAVMVVEPAMRPLTVPFGGTRDAWSGGSPSAPFETAATTPSPEVQVTWLVMSLRVVFLPLA